MEKYSNKRIMVRKQGRFAKVTAKDMGIGGVCAVCNSILIRVYDGPADGFTDPGKFRNRCYTCEPER